MEGENFWKLNQDRLNNHWL